MESLIRTTVISALIIASPDKLIILYKEMTTVWGTLKHLRALLEI